MITAMLATRAIQGAVLQLLAMGCFVGAISGCSMVVAPSGDVKKEVVRTLRENPDLVIEALSKNDSALLGLIQGASTREQARKVREQRLAELQNPFEPVIAPTRAVLGSHDALITIVEYVDFECPYSAKAAVIVRQVMDAHKGQVKLVLKHYPLEFHKAALPAARYFEAIAKQSTEQAWQFHDRIFAQQTQLKDGDTALRRIVESLPIDTQRLDQDIASDAVQTTIASDQGEAFAFGVSGTPTFLINGVALRGAYPVQDFDEIIRMILQDRRN
jgi:protein-disulfide isomerase